MKLTALDLSSKTLDIVTRDFDGFFSGEPGLSSIRGGQTAANAALANLDITQYAKMRSEVLPRSRRGASVLSPYIRHNFLTLKQVHHCVKDAPYQDREKFRDELYWQEYARHLYARVGTRLFENLRFEANKDALGEGWNREMLCIDEVVSELESDGWLVNQTECGWRPTGPSETMWAGFMVRSECTVSCSTDPALLTCWAGNGPWERERVSPTVLPSGKWRNVRRDYAASVP